MHNKTGGAEMEEKRREGGGGRHCMIILLSGWKLSEKCNRDICYREAFVGEKAR